MIAHHGMNVKDTIRLGRTKRVTFYPNKYFVEQLNFYEGVMLRGEGRVEDWANLMKKKNLR